jgi:decaprenyl-phosphate phosphoribosyltransferase
VTPYLKAMRLERWPRSLAIFLGSAAYFFFDRTALGAASGPDVLGRTGAAFLLTWAVSTANYILNEIVDRPHDAHHPTKKFRPLVRGEIKAGPLAFLGLVLLVLAFIASAILFKPAFGLSLLLLFLAGIVYNVKPIRTKDIPFLDAISESANNPIRFLIGWFAFAPASGPPPLSLLVSWWAFGNYLMIAKRFTEFRFLKDKAGDYRSSHKKYSERSLLAGMAASAVVSLAAFLLCAATYKLQMFVLIAPVIVVLFYFIYRRTLDESGVMEEAEQMLASPLFALSTLILLGLFVAAYFVDAIGR